MRLRVIVNPAAGREEPVLGALGRVFSAAHVHWEVAVTQGDDARRLAAEAVAEGVDVVAAYGGDGTVSAVGNALAGGAVPLAILPGGTGNVIAQELGVPLDLEAAAGLACEGPALARPMDTLRVGERLSLLRVGVGADARTIEGSTRARKDELGWWAYLLATLGQLGETRPARYAIEVDGRAIETDAVTVVVANIGRIGRGGLSISRAITPFDGLLDLVVVRTTDLAGITSVAASLFGVREPTGLDAAEDAALAHARGRRVRLAADRDEPVHVDGELGGSLPLVVEVVPGSLRVVLPERGKAEPG